MRVSHCRTATAGSGLLQDERAVAVVQGWAFCYLGMMTASMTWMTPLLAWMSVCTTFAPSTFTPSLVSIVVMVPPWTVGRCQVHYVFRHDLAWHHVIGENGSQGLLVCQKRLEVLLRTAAKASSVGGTPCMDLHLEASPRALPPLSPQPVSRSCQRRPRHRHVTRAASSAAAAAVLTSCGGWLPQYMVGCTLLGCIMGGPYGHGGFRRSRWMPSDVAVAVVSVSGVHASTALSGTAFSMALTLSPSPSRTAVASVALRNDMLGDSR